MQSATRTRKLDASSPSACSCKTSCRSEACLQESQMTAVGFEPTQLALVELESTPLDHSGKLSMQARQGPFAARRESCRYAKQPFSLMRHVAFECTHTHCCSALWKTPAPLSIKLLGLRSLEGVLACRQRFGPMRRQICMPDGYIAQWLERLTADQQVPGSNPGVPFAR